MAGDPGGRTVTADAAHPGRDPLTVLFVTSNANLGSSTRTLRDWLRLAPAHGVRPLVAAPPDGPLADVLAGDGVPVSVGDHPWPDRRRPWRGSPRLLRLAAWAKWERADLIFSNEHDVYPFVKALRRLTGLPAVCHIHFVVGADFADWAFGGLPPDAAVWTSHSQRAGSASRVNPHVPPDRQAVISLGVDPDRFAAGLPDRAAAKRRFGLPASGRVLATASALRPRKRVHEFLDLFARLSADRADLTCAIAGHVVPGDEGYKAELDRRVAALPDPAKVRLLGHTDEVAAFLRAADLFVSTSEHETFGMSVLEAMAVGTPVAAYEGGSVGEVVADAGPVVPTGDLNALTAACEILLDDPAARAAATAAGLARVRAEFDPAASFPRLAGVMRAAAAGRPVPEPV